MTGTASCALGVGALTSLSAAVVYRMERDFHHHDALRPSTVAAMYATYAAHLGAFAWAATNRIWPLPLPRRLATVGGGLTVAVGAGVMVAGMARFDSPAQLSGTETGTLHDRGIYRYTRNPQYLGAVLALAGASVVSRSGLAALLTTGVLATYWRWVPNEERVLRRTFGQDYDRYAATVHRWFGRSTSGQQGALQRSLAMTRRSSYSPTWAASTSN